MNTEKYLFKFLYFLYAIDIYKSFFMVWFISSKIEDLIFPPLYQLPEKFGLSYILINLIGLIVLFVIYTELIIKYTNKKVTKILLITLVVFIIINLYINLFETRRRFILFLICALILCILYIYISKIVSKVQSNKDKDFKLWIRIVIILVINAFGFYCWTFSLF